MADARFHEVLVIAQDPAAYWLARHALSAVAEAVIARVAGEDRCRHLELPPHAPWAMALRFSAAAWPVAEPLLRERLAPVVHAHGMFMTVEEKDAAGCAARPIVRLIPKRIARP